MTAAMKDALQAALRLDGLRRVEEDQPGTAPWPAHPLTLHALVRGGLLERTERKSRKGHTVTTWAVTDAGREALDPPPVVRPDERRSMGTSRTSTMLPLAGGNIWEVRTVPEPEKVDPRIVENLPSTIEARQRWHAERLQRERAREDMPLGELVERELAAAQLAGVDTHEYEQSILRRLRALRNRARRAA